MRFLSKARRALAADVGAPKIDGRHDIRQANGPLVAFPRVGAPAFS